MPKVQVYQNDLKLTQEEFQAILDAITENPDYPAGHPIYHDALVNGYDYIPYGFFYNLNTNSYYYGDRRLETDISVEEKPSDYHDYVENTGWVLNEERLRTAKLYRLRELRDTILNITMWVKQRYECEKLAIELDVHGASYSLTQEQLIAWLTYWGYLRDLPSTINIDNYSLNDIYITNKTIFGEFPTPNELTPINI